MPEEKGNQNKTTSKSKSSSGGSQQKLIIIILILFVIAAGGFIWAYNNYRQSQKVIQELRNKQQGQQMTEEQRQKLLSRVKKHMVLPEEQPAIISINNPKELAKREDFFKPAQENDLLLLYRNKAILYRSSTDKIVDVQPVRTPNTSTQQRRRTNTSTQTNSISVDVRNGGAASGSASELAERLEKRPQYTVTNVGNAATSTYRENILIHNNTETDISTLEQQLGVSSTTELPQGESSSNADAIIILAD